MKRRDFLQASAAATLLAPQRILGANDRLRVALIGAGGRGRSVTRRARDTPNVEIVAVSDVYVPRREQAAQEMGETAKPAKDYREILGRKDIDAVIIATPDHWHTPMILEAISAGKDVYCEKPVTHQIEEGEKLIAAVEGSKQVVATGTQQRSWDHYLAAKKIIDSGELGQISFVENWWYQDYLSSKDPGEVDVSQLDWQQWLGPGPKQPFDAMKFRRWRFFWDFGGGVFTDLMTHWIDVIQWFMNSPEPERVQASGSTHAATWLESPDTVTATLLYPQDYTVLYHSSMIGRLEGGGILFRGSKAMLKLTRDGYAVYPEGAVPSEFTGLPQPVKKMEQTGDGTKTNVENWIDCVRTRKTPNAHIRAGVEAARTSHLANIAMRQEKIVRS
jgi:predicted dehydrogenase